MPPVDSPMTQASTHFDPAPSLTHTLREAARHGERAVLLCSFQKEESVLLDELLRLDQGTGDAVRVLTIDTGVLFEETMKTWRAFEERFGLAPAMRLDHADDHIDAVALLGSRGQQHLVGIADPWCGAEKYLQPPATLLFCRGEQCFG